MAGISSKALGFGNPVNKYKFNGIEEVGEFGLQDLDAKFREYDPQIGRWWEIDPKTDKMEMWSPYTAMYDNPIRYSDPLGDEPDSDDKYKVRKGDNLINIAKANNTTVQAIVQVNPNIKDPNKIQVGQEISLPGSATTNSNNTTSNNNTNSQQQQGGNNNQQQPTHGKQGTKTPTVGLIVTAAGLPIFPKLLIPKIIFRNFVPEGASLLTSPSSVLFRSIIPSSWPRTGWLPKATSLGGQFGRATGSIGAYITIGQVVYNNWQNMTPAEKRDTYRVASPGGFVPSSNLETIPTKIGNEHD